MISGRRTYMDLAAKMADVDLPYYFYDGHAKINYDIDQNNVASLSFYAGNDILDLDNDGTAIGLNWGNRTFSGQWTHLFSSKLFSHFVLAAVALPATHASGSIKSLSGCSIESAIGQAKAY